MLLDIVVLAVATVVLAGFQWWAYRRWMRPHEPLSTSAKAVLMLAVLTLSGGFLGAFSWWLDVPGSFSWDVPPLASRFLATAGWCFALLSYATLRRPTHRRVRLYLGLLAVYMAPLVVAILLFHMDRFDWSQPITYSFFILVVILTGGALWFRWRQPKILDDRPDDLIPTSAAVRSWLILVTLVTLLWGLALFLTERGPSALIWAWPRDLLSSRLVSVMLLTIGVSSAITWRYRDGARLTLQLATLYGLGVALGSAVNPWLTGKPVPTAYFIVMAALFLGSGTLLLVDTTVARVHRESGDAFA